MKPTAEQIFEIIRNSNVTSTNPEELVAHLPLGDQGVDSLDRAMVFLNIQEEFGVTFEKADYPRLQSVDAVVAFLNEERPGA
jgi:acyl carrier protein